MTIIVRAIDTGEGYEVLSRKYLGRKRNFYRKDRQGYYFIPEVIKNER